VGGKLALAAVCLLAVSACGQDMGSQPSYRPLQPSDSFPDGRASRPLVTGTVARGQLRADRALYGGKDDKGEFVTTFPFEMTKQVIERGRQRYNIFCAPCHGLDGRGNGRIAQRGFTKPPSYITDPSRWYALRGIKTKDGRAMPLIEAPVGHYYDVISNGFGAMADYAEQVPVRDRWAIIGYIRALQYSQSPATRERLTGRDRK
jgi:mono/diheme cytochrome c family protein